MGLAGEVVHVGVHSYSDFIVLFKKCNGKLADGLWVLSDELWAVSDEQKLSPPLLVPKLPLGNAQLRSSCFSLAGFRV
jgi:hypothetical protein